MNVVKVILKKIKLNINVVYIALIFLAIFCLCFLFPVTGDDLYWGSSYGMDELKNRFTNMNGRYAGNLLVLALTRSRILSAAIISLSLIVLLILSVKFSFDDKRLFSYCFVTLLLLFLPQNVLVQTVSWTAGFANYIPPTIFLLSSILLMKNIFEDDIPKYSVFKTIIVSLLGFAGALFIENITIFNIVLAVAILVFSFVKFKKVFITHIMYIISTISGALIMFLNPAYRAVASGGDSYRAMAGFSDLVQAVIGKNIGRIFDGFFTENVILLCIISVLCIYIATKKQSNNGKKNLFSTIFIVLNLFFLTLIFIKFLFPEWNMFLDEESTRLINYIIFALIALGYYITLLLMVVLNVDDVKEKVKIMFFLLCIPIMIAPLVVVSPIGPRCFFSSCIMLIVAISLLLNYILRGLSFDIYNFKFITLSSLFMIFVIFVFYIGMYSNIYVANNIRDEYIQKQIKDGSKEVIVCMQPYPSYIWNGDPTTEYLDDVYKNYHNIDKDIKFTFMDYNEFQIWKQEYDKTHTSQ